MTSPQSSGLQPIRWEDLPEKVWLPTWAELARNHAASLKGITPATLPQYATSTHALAERLGFASEEDGAEKDDQGAVRSLTGGALCVLFHNKGWEIIAQPGESVILQKDETAFHPFEVTEQLESGALSSEKWKRICDLAGVADSDLGEDMQF